MRETSEGSSYYMVRLVFREFLLSSDSNNNNNNNNNDNRNNVNDNRNDRTIKPSTKGWRYFATLSE